MLSPESCQDPERGRQGDSHHRKADRPTDDCMGRRRSKPDDKLAATFLDVLALEACVLNFGPYLGNHVARRSMAAVPAEAPCAQVSPRRPSREPDDGSLLPAVTRTSRVACRSELFPMGAIPMISRWPSTPPPRPARKQRSLPGRGLVVGRHPVGPRHRHAAAIPDKPAYRRLPDRRGRHRPDLGGFDNAATNLAAQLREQGVHPGDPGRGVARRHPAIPCWWPSNASRWPSAWARPRRCAVAPSSPRTRPACWSATPRAAAGRAPWSPGRAARRVYRRIW